MGPPEDGAGDSAEGGAEGSAGAPSPLHDVLSALAASGVELSREELVDALWLAARLPADASAPLARATGLTAPPAAESAEDVEDCADFEDYEDFDEAACADEAEDFEAERRSAQGSAAYGTLHGTVSVAPDAAQTSAPSYSMPRGPHAASQHRDDAPAQAARLATTPLYAGAVAPRVAPSAAGRVRPVRTPGAKALGQRQLQLGRALRPLKQSRPDRRRWELDEVASADSAAESGLADAVLRPGRARWLDLALLVDDGVSMLLWQRLAAETRLLLERSGAFRTVRVHGLDTRSAAAPLLGRAYSPGTAVLPPATVTDPGGNTLVLVVSDGVGAAWRDGRMRTLLKQWARCGPTAVLHALPEHLWDGSGLRAERWQVTTRRRGAPNLTWDVADPVLPPELAAFDGIPVPVLAPEPDAVGAWAALVASPGTSAVLPLLAAPDPVAARPSRTDAGARPRTTASGVPYGASRPSGAGAANAVLRFRDTASPQAYRLAAQLAALAPLSVPVMRLTQGALGPDVTTGHLAEVFLSGLMHRADGTHSAAELPPQHRGFDFDDEARELLLSAAPVPELVRTGRAVSRRLAELAGRSADFPAWMAHPAGTEWADAGARPFGWVDERMLRRLGVGGAPASSARGGRPVAAPGAATAKGVPVEDVAVEDVAVEDLPAYVDSPGSDWRSLVPGNPRWAGPWRLFAQHDTARTTSGLFLGRLDGTGDVAALRLTRPGSVARMTLPRQAAALRSLGGERAPFLVALDPAAEPAWIATGITWADGRPAPDLGRHVAASGRIDDAAEFARFGRRLAGALAWAHSRGIAHGDLVARRILVADGDVCVTGWRVEEHADGTAHDVSKLGEVLASVAGQGLPLAYHGLLKLCGSPLLHVRPSAAQVFAHFDEFIRDGVGRLALRARVGRTVTAGQFGTELVLDFDSMGPHGGIRGTPDQQAAVLETLVRDIGTHRSPTDVQIVLVGEATRCVSPRTAASLPHVVLAPHTPDATHALYLEVRRRQTRADEARDTGAPPPAESRLIAVLGRSAAEEVRTWPVQVHHGLGVHLVFLDPDLIAHSADVLGFVIDAVDMGHLGGQGVLRHAGEATHFTLLPTPPLPPPTEAPPVTAPSIEPTRQAQLVVEARNAVAVGRAGHPEQALADLVHIAENQRLLLGPDHPETLDSVYELASLHAQLGRLPDALALSTDTAERRARVLGPRHPDTLTAQQQCAFVLGQLGRHEESYATYRRVLSSWEATRGPAHPSTLLCRHNLAVALILLRRYEEAADQARLAHSGRVLVRGAEHPDTLASAHELAVALRGSGHEAEAYAVATDVHAARLRVLGRDHPDTRATQALLTSPKRPGG
ncbi:SAV_2336 N-terminal domain-related protein [Streptomyces lasiicapitis]|uniref:SAV_2336 N-terminal domain-related protein n=1 Tax=Streptomyces lasiicapitis TaxID=1923961 RepID=UPI003657C7AC